MLKSQARRRIATKAAAAGTLSAGALLFGLPQLASSSALVPTSYTCTPTGTGTGTYSVTLDFGAAATTAPPNQPVTVTLQVAQGASPLTAPTALTTADYVWVESEVVVSPVAGTPLPSGEVTSTASSVPLAAVEASAPLVLPPANIFTLNPTARGTLGLSAEKLTVKIGPTPAVGASPSAPIAYTCILPATGATAPARLTLVVASASASTSPTITPSETPTPTPTRSTPRPTRTATATVTADSQVKETPNGGAATGGGADAGPDGRMFVAVGSVVVLGAAVGGLMMRRRPQRG